MTAPPAAIKVTHSAAADELSIKYKPLPECIEVKKSPIEGFGLFAIEDIGENFDLGVSHIKVPIIHGYVRTSIGGFLKAVNDFNPAERANYINDNYQTFDLNQLNETLSADIEKNNEFRIKWPRSEMGALPEDAEQNLKIIYIEKQIEEQKKLLRSLERQLIEMKASK